MTRLRNHPVLGTLPELKFDGIATVCVFAWEERARESSIHNRERIQQYVAKFGGS